MESVDSVREHISDEELARQTRAGSLSSFEELVFRYEARIFRMLQQRCRCESDARELTQIAFVTAYRSIRLFKPTHSFGAWLFTIARRKFLDHCRAVKREEGAPAPLEAADANDPSAILLQHEQEADVWHEARRLLSPDQFDALWLKYQEDMSVRDIARVLGRTQTSVKVMLFRARRRLLNEMSRDGKESPMAKSAPLRSSAGAPSDRRIQTPVTL